MACSPSPLGHAAPANGSIPGGRGCLSSPRQLEGPGTGQPALPACSPRASRAHGHWKQRGKSSCPPREKLTCCRSGGAHSFARVNTWWRGGRLGENTGTWPGETLQRKAPSPSETTTGEGAEERLQRGLSTTPWYLPAEPEGPPLSRQRAGRVDSAPGPQDLWPQHGEDTQG